MRNIFERPNIELPDEFAIHAENLSVVADETTLALSGLSLTVEPGEYVGIVGHNGSGKTTYENMILGLGGGTLQVKEGSVKYDELDIYQKPMNEHYRTVLRRRHFGYVPKVPVFDADRTVADNILRPHKLNGRKVTAEDLREVAEQFEVFDLLRAPIKALSSGQQQRVNVVRGLVSRPNIAVLDEPTDALDVEHKEKLVTNLQRYARELGKTVIIVSHEETGADRLVTLSSGAVESDVIRSQGVAA